MISFLIDHLLESTVFALLMGQLTLIFANNRASVRYGLWLAASVKFLIPFSAIVAAGSFLRWDTAPSVALDLPRLMSDAVPDFTLADLALPAPLVDATLAPLAALPAAPGIAGLDPGSIALGAWLVGCGLLLCHWIEQWLYLRAVRKASTPAPFAAAIPVRFSRMLFEPGLVGVFRPILLLPEGITAQLAPAQLALVIEHELCHWRRRDNLTAAIHMAVQLVFWFHPFVWWIGKCLVAERERACDEGVLAAGSDPKAYAGSILEVCRFYLRSPLPCAAGVAGANLKHRVRRIMENGTSTRLSRVKLTLLAGIAAGAVLLPMALGLLTPEAAAAPIHPAVAPHPVGQAVPALNPAPAARTAPLVVKTSTSPTPRPRATPAPKTVGAAPARQAQPREETPVAANTAAPKEISTTATPAKVAPPTTPMDEIVVTGKAIREFVRTRNFVRSYTAPSEFLDQISRWHEPLCVRTQGLAKGYNDFVTKRVKEVAAEIGAPTAQSEPCKPNLAIFFTPHPQDLLDYIKTKRPDLLGPYYPAMLKKLATVAYPVQAWYATGTRDAHGRRSIDTYDWGSVPGMSGIDGIDAPVYTTLASHVRTGLTSEFASVVIVADIPRIEDWEIGTIADYIAMQALARAKTPDKCQQVPSITNALGNCGDGVRAKALSEFDLAYLKALYLSTPDAPRGLQESGIGHAMLKILEKRIAAK